MMIVTLIMNYFLVMIVTLITIHLAKPLFVRVIIPLIMIPLIPLIRLITTLIRLIFCRLK